MVHGIIFIFFVINSQGVQITARARYVFGFMILYSYSRRKNEQHIIQWFEIHNIVILFSCPKTQDYRTINYDTVIVMDKVQLKQKHIQKSIRIATNKYKKGG